MYSSTEYDPNIKKSSSAIDCDDDGCTDQNWVLQIKIVGNERMNQQFSDFHISLHPNDDIIQLYHQITNKTDIPYHQQRLIYRGRLLPHIEQHHKTSTKASKKSSLMTSEDVLNLTEDDLYENFADLFTTNDDDNTTQKTAPPKTQQQQQTSLNQKVCDIVGLMNGHAIHLVVRPNTVVDDNEEGNEEGLTSDPESTASSSSSSSSSTTSSGGSLLAALLGLSSGGERLSSSTTAANHSNSRSSRGSRQQHTYRLSEEDWIRPDPGSLETVRQGLMTFHTLQQQQHFHHSTTTSTSTTTAASTTTTTPNNDSSTITNHRHGRHIGGGRHFYLGQWIDCRDTVNQWLEATVVSILYPRDIMHLYHNATPNDEATATDDTNMMTFQQPTTDPAIAVTDFDGRRRLLLEPCNENESEECIDGIHYRRRANNEHVQILHIHYNGWPVRWDEWIRSDSERIRVFRTRTRHQPTPVNVVDSAESQQQRHYISPNIDSVMPDAPYTYITNNESNDRMALLPEIHRALQTLQDRVATSSVIMTANNTTTNHQNAIRTASTSRMNHLPWNTNHNHETALRNINNSATAIASQSNCGDGTNQDNSQQRKSHLSLRRSQIALSRQQQRQELESLAPLLDRLGRVLIDAAPHVLALADRLGQEEVDENDVEGNEENRMANSFDDADEIETETTPPATNTLSGLLSLLNRDRRSGGRGSVTSDSNVAVPSVVSDVEISTVASSSTATTTDVVVNPTEPGRSTTNSEVNNILEPVDVDDDNNNNDEDVFYDGNEETSEYVDPDYRDYVTSLVNTSRGDARSTSGGGNSNRRSSAGDDGATSLLGAYLAAMSLGGIASISTSERDEGDAGSDVAEGLGRMFRARGSGSGGIDIHIHAVVTAPGLDGAIGFAALTGGGGGATFPGATPVMEQNTTTNGTNGAFGNIFDGASTQRRAGSRRFRSMNATIEDHIVVEEATIVEEEDLGLFADLYSETPDPINPHSPTIQMPAVTLIDESNEDDIEHQESRSHLSSSLRQSRSRSIRRFHDSHPSNSSDIYGEYFQSNSHRTNRSEARNASNEQRNSNNGNNNLLRRIFRRADGGH